MTSSDALHRRRLLKFKGLLLPFELTPDKDLLSFGPEKLEKLGDKWSRSMAGLAQERQNRDRGICESIWLVIADHAKMVDVVGMDSVMVGPCKEKAFLTTIICCQDLSSSQQLLHLVNTWDFIIKNKFKVYLQLNKHRRRIRLLACLSTPQDKVESIAVYPLMTTIEVLEGISIMMKTKGKPEH